MSDLLTPLATEPVMVELRAALRPFASELVTRPDRANHARAKKSRATRAAVKSLLALGMSQREAAEAAARAWWDAVSEEGRQMAERKTQGNGSEIIPRAAWIRRYADRIKIRSGLDEAEALELAEIAAQEYEREVGNEAVWTAGPINPYDTPEDCADEDMSYWDDDEGTCHG